MPQPDPNSWHIQIESAAVVAKFLELAGHPKLDPFTQTAVLLTLEEPVLQRLGHAIEKAGAIYAKAQEKPLGYYACLAFHNRGIDTTWDGGTPDAPYGAPNVPA